MTLHVTLSVAFRRRTPHSRFLLLAPLCARAAVFVLSSFLLVCPLFLIRAAFSFLSFPRGVAIFVCVSPFYEAFLSLETHIHPVGVTWVSLLGLRLSRHDE